NSGLDRTAPPRSTYNDYKAGRVIKRAFTINPEELEKPLQITPEQRAIVNMYVDENNWLGVNKLRLLVLTELLLKLPWRSIKTLIRRAKEGAFKQFRRLLF